MLRLFVSFSMLIVSSLCSFAQDRCNIDLSIAPDIRVIRLGLKIEELKAKFPELPPFKFAKEPDEAGVIDSIDLHRWDWDEKRREQFKGVEEMSLVFADGKLVKIGVGYDDSANWPDIDSFALQVSKRLALPPAWRAPDNADPATARVMDCGGFRVIAVAPRVGQTFVGLVDTSAEKIVKERRATIAEKKRQAFKP